MILELAASFGLSFVLTVLIGSMLVPMLRRIKAGQSIREDGPRWHMTKQGTPTMGGLMFIISIGVVSFVMGYPSMLQGDYRHLFVFAFAMVYAAVGFLDDFRSEERRVGKEC